MCKENEPTVDVTIPMGMTLVPKQYEALNPAVSLTLRNIPLDDLAKVHDPLASIVSNMFLVNLMSQYSIYKGIQDEGLGNTVNKLIGDIDEIEKELTDSLNELKAVLKKE